MILKKEHEIKVLIVDDQDAVVDLCREMLQGSFGFQEVFTGGMLLMSS